MPLSKRAKKKTTLPKFNRFMSKTSETSLKNEKRTDTSINPIVSICLSVYHMISVLRVKINSIYYMITAFQSK